jgi:hypothetical protein
MGHFWPVLFFDFDFEGIDLSLAPPFREAIRGVWELLRRDLDTVR